MKLWSIFFLVAALLSNAVLANMPEWSYDAGPDRDTEMGRELIQITADIPNMPEISNKIMGRKQKFRPAFGPIPWRMVQTPNKVKMLFIGQDGTHIAEAAGRPATAGFGGRAQDLAKFFGVNEGAAFINTYSFTIKGQYGVYNTPYIKTKKGKTSVAFSNFVDEKLWAMSMGLDSPVTKWRNRLIDWIIRNNKESMKLIVTFGGAARDAIATYAISKGAKVEAFGQKDMKKIQIPVTKGEYAGGNNTFPSLVGKDGKDLYAKMLGKKRVDYTKSANQKAVAADLKANLKEYIKEMVFTKGGPYRNGLLNAAQLKGYNVGKMIINGTTTRSLKGLVLDDGTVIENDVLVVELPHPSSLSRTVMDAGNYAEGKAKASKRVMDRVRALNHYRDNEGWNIDADPDQENQYAAGKSYTYGRSDIGPEFYDFGTPRNRMVSKSTAKRMGGNANVVIIGTRDNGKFDKSAVKKMTNSKPAFGINSEDLYIARPRSGNGLFSFDAGPGEELAKIMIENLDIKEIFKAKEGMSWEEHGIDAFNVKTHEKVSDFGHYRGTFKAPRVLILADPIGYDDLVTAKALTGERGQYLQGLMEDIGVEDNYLVFKTVPFGMDEATADEWNVVIEQTKAYREEVLKKVAAEGSLELVLADGEQAQKEATRIFIAAGIPIVNIDRESSSKRSGIKTAGYAISELEGFEDVVASGNIANIPRSHLSYYSRVWEGTSGDRAITSNGKKYKGLAFAEAVPAWAFNQNWSLSKNSSEDVDALLKLLKKNKLPLPGEKIPAYLERTTKPLKRAIKKMNEAVLEPVKAFIKRLKLRKMAEK